MNRCIYLVFAFLFVVSCSTAIKVDPFLDNKGSSQVQKKNCKDDCKGLKGKARADCNRNCN